jgi:HPt (histidine-containing phosphotransfer) domain-containing protein
MPKPMRDVPILAMTGNAAPTQIRSFLDAGMNGYVAKPISRAMLQQTLSQWERPGLGSTTEAAPVDGGEIAELISALGAGGVAKIAKAFLRDLTAAFPPECTLDEAKREAHALVNCAGVLGLARFVAACRTLEYLPADDFGVGPAALAQIRAERSLAREYVAGKLLPDLENRRLRPTG